MRPADAELDPEAEWRVRCEEVREEAGVVYLAHPRARDARERKIEFFRILPAVSVVLYRGSPIDHFQKDGQNSQFLNFLRKCPLNNTPYGSQPLPPPAPRAAPLVRAAPSS